MKTLLLLGSAALLYACGSSSSGTPPASSAVQTPQQPAPVNSQQPPGNSQQAPMNSQQPPGNSQQAPANSQQPPLNGTSTPPAITCAQLAAALQTGGCHISNSEMSDCVAGTAANMPCGAEWQAVFACLLHGVTCNNANGTVNVNDACPDQSDALGACLGNVAPQADCSAASNCNGCADTCALCQCTVTTDPITTCAPLCPTN